MWILDSTYVIFSLYLVLMSGNQWMNHMWILAVSYERQISTNLSPLFFHLIITITLIKIMGKRTLSVEERYSNTINQIKEILHDHGPREKLINAWNFCNNKNNKSFDANV